MSRIHLAALVAAVTLVPAAAQAQSTITACYVPKTGSVYRVKAEGAPDACKSNHVEFSWKVPDVTYGAITTVTEAFTVQPGTLGGGGADCAPGSVAISGGYVPKTVQDFNQNFQVRLNANHPQTPGWRVTGFNYGTTPVEFIVQAYCAPVSQ